MRRFSLLTTFVLSLMSTAPTFAATPQIGQAAPGFTLQDRGRWLVLYFYPKDFTGGCTSEVCTFRDDIAKLRKAGAEVVGVSLDNVKSHADFAAKYHVPFPLLSDASRKTATEYGVLSNMAGMAYALRETFLVAPDGKIAKVYKDVDPEKNSGQVLTDLAELKAG
jgi:thioredoxin-dependent peroxiredoxin